MMLQLSAPPLPLFLAAGEDTYGIGQSHPNRHQLGVFDLLIVAEGSLTMGEEEHRFQVDAGQALILYPDRHHFAIAPCEKVTHFYWFHFSSAKEWETVTDAPAVPAKETEFARNRNVFAEEPFVIRLPKQCTLRNWGEVESLCRRILMNDSIGEQPSEWSRHILFQQLLKEMADSVHLAKHLPAAAVAEKAAAYLRQHYPEKISYRRLGEALRFHPNHIARCMTGVLGCTPVEYVNRVRTEQAKLLLVSTDWSIERIAERCGFSQTAYFSRIFKRQEGVQPKEFRKLYTGQRL